MVSFASRWTDLPSPRRDRAEADAHALQLDSEVSDE
jgi:hypothetical protein